MIVQYQCFQRKHALSHQTAFIVSYKQLCRKTNNFFPPFQDPLKKHTTTLSHQSHLLRYRQGVFPFITKRKCRNSFKKCLSLELLKSVKARGWLLLSTYLKSQVGYEYVLIIGNSIREPNRILIHYL